MDIGSIDHLRVATISNCNSLAELHTPNITVTAGHIKSSLSSVTLLLLPTVNLISSRHEPRNCMRISWDSHAMATQAVHWRAVCCLATENILSIVAWAYFGLGLERDLILLLRARQSRGAYGAVA
jgi:hypothetical protein